ncbi:hypothetical protein CAPTEDRAFT_194690 [Capitella teleta]|uniref:Uncharacterized protein n=1 Tax=Capitella teleta TaxID=283909 RepID=R7TDG8_CAPTE|nr:hypothetical protein CAPTEDRAFT_194690 [Capitella teleta]|eukprot:ELT91773.1 hypothetical protein CAPTEDRAFT_194690 [Capitella teleta]
MANSCLRRRMNSNTNPNNFTSLPEEPRRHSAMNTKLIFLGCVASAMLVISACTNDDADKNRACNIKCGQETPGCSRVEDLIANNCFVRGFPCYYNCTVGEPDKNHGINKYDVSKMILNRSCFQKCRENYETCAKGHFVSLQCMGDTSGCYFGCAVSEKQAN